MRDFDHKLLRLKQALGLVEDQAVAETLGLSKAAFSDRKRRNAFPEEKVLALATRRPDLTIDVNYVLKGETAKQAAQKMLDNFGPRLRELRGKRSIASFAKALQITPDELQGIETGLGGPLKHVFERLQVLYPRENPVWLAGGEPERLDSPLNGAETTLILNFRRTTEEGQAELMRMAAALAKK